MKNVPNHGTCMHQQVSDFQGKASCESSELTPHTPYRWLLLAAMFPRAVVVASEDVVSHAHLSGDCRLALPQKWIDRG